MMEEIPCRSSPRAADTHRHWDVELIVMEEVGQVGFVAALVECTSPARSIKIVHVEAGSRNKLVSF